MLTGQRSPALISLIALMALSSCSWRAEDRGLFASYAMFSAVDVSQTARISQSGYLREGNPLFAREDGSPDMTRVIVIKTVGAALIYALLDTAREGRTEVLALVNGIQGGVVVWNDYWLRNPPPGPPPAKTAAWEEVYYCPSLAGLDALHGMGGLDRSQCERAVMAVGIYHIAR